MTDAQIANMRATISKQYTGLYWKAKVSKMPVKQVIAIYNTMKETGRLDRKPVVMEEPYHQINIFEYMEEMV